MHNELLQLPTLMIAEGAVGNVKPSLCRVHHHAAVG
jgi:hypothetical protein